MRESTQTGWTDTPLRTIDLSLFSEYTVYDFTGTLIPNDIQMYKE